MASDVTRVEFFFDPVCPWAWITSRWVVEAAPRRDVQIDWRFIALRIVNEARNYDTDFPPGYPAIHGAGLKYLRIAAAVREVGGNEAVGRWYMAIGTMLHNEGEGGPIRKGEIDPREVAAEALERVGLDTSLLDAMDDESRDALLREETELCLGRTGRDVGTPIITFDPGTPGEASFFGPVLARIPRGDEAIAVWDAVLTLARTPGMAELKRSLRERPSFD